MPEHEENTDKSIFPYGTESIQWQHGPKGEPGRRDKVLGVVVPIAMVLGIVAFFDFVLPILAGGHR